MSSSYSVRRAEETELARTSQPAYVVGLDFGTYGSGPAYAQITEGADPVIHEYDLWPDQPEHYPKTRSAILYRGRQVLAWGWTALKEYEKLMQEGSRDVTLVNDIKLLLFEKQPGGAAVEKPAIPARMTARQVIGDFLKEMRKFVTGLMRKHYGPAFHEDLVLWTLTVPAIWTAAQKSTMRRAAVLGGLIHGVESTRLLIVLEPEAAAVAALHSVMPPPTDVLRRLLLSPAEPPAIGITRSISLQGGVPLAAPPLLDVGDVLMVVDCGGGTSDVTLHQVVEKRGRRRLREAAVGDGGPCGSTAIDRRIEQWAREQVGASLWTSWSTEGDELVRFRNSLESDKRRMNRISPRRELAPAGPTSDGSVADSVTDGDAEEDNSSEDYSGTEGDSASVASGPTGPGSSGKPGTGATWFGEFGSDGFYEFDMPANLSLRLRLLPEGAPLGPGVVDRRRWRVDVSALLGPVAEEVLAIIERVLRAGEANGMACNKLLLVGGFGCSRFLQSTIIRHLNTAYPGIRVILPDRPDNAVLKGAVFYGCDPHFIASRRSRNCYGIATTLPWSAEHAHSLRVHGYPKKLSSVNSADDCFHLYVSRNQVIEVDDTVSHTFRPTCADQCGGLIDIFASDSNGIKYVVEPGVRKVGELVLMLPNNWSQRVPLENMEVSFSMKFGATEIQCQAIEKLSKEPVTTTVRFASDVADEMDDD